jgi:hypothetical protein
VFRTGFIHKTAITCPVSVLERDTSNAFLHKGIFRLKDTGVSTRVSTLHKMLKIRAHRGTTYLPTLGLHIISDII